MKILAMDTASAACSCAISSDGEIIAHHFEEMARGHASALLPMIEQTLKEAQMAMGALDALAVTIGPGAFTGLRIALATARGFGVSTNLPVIGVTTLESLSCAVLPDERADRPVLCALDAKRADIYAQVFDAEGAAIGEPVAQLPETLVELVPAETHEIIIAGDSFDRVSAFFEAVSIKAVRAKAIWPDARYVAEVASQKGIDEAKSRPSALYIRPPDAVVPQNGGRLRP